MLLKTINLSNAEETQICTGDSAAQEGVLKTGGKKYFALGKAENRIIFGRYTFSDKLLQMKWKFSNPYTNSINVYALLPSERFEMDEEFFNYNESAKRYSFRKKKRGD